MIVVFFVFLLQTFCYGAESTPTGSVVFHRITTNPVAFAELELKRPLGRIITEDGVCPFFYHYCKKFYETFRDKEVAPLPPRDDIKGLLSWSEQYFSENHLHLTSEDLESFVDSKLLEALKTLPLNSVDEDVEVIVNPLQHQLKRKTFIIPGCVSGTLKTAIKQCSPATLYVLASKQKLLTPKKREGSTHKKTPKLLNNKCTEFSYATLLSEACEKDGVRVTVVEAPNKVGKARSCSEDPFHKSLLFVKTFLAEKLGDVDGIVSDYPYGIAKQKIVKYIFGWDVAFYDFHKPQPLCFLEVLQALSYTLHTEYRLRRLEALKRSQTVDKGVDIHPVTEQRAKKTLQTTEEKEVVKDLQKIIREDGVLSSFFHTSNTLV